MELRNIFTACAAAACTLVTTAPAQQAFDHWTIEALATQARVVFRGSVTMILGSDLESKPGEPARVSNMLTIAVGERMKGHPDSWMTLVQDTLASDNRCDLWMKSAAPMLWFTFSEEDPRPFPGSTIGPGLPVQPGRSWTAVYVTPPNAAEIAADPHAGQGIFSMDFTVIKDGNAIGEAVKRFLKAVPNRAKVCRISVPASITGAIGYTGGMQHIVVPVTPELEPIALRMINAPDSFLPKDHAAAETAWIRASGVRTLANFQSDKNAALLKTLLNDPGKGPNDSTETPVKTYYWVRLAAFDVLNGWGQKVPKPALQ